METTLWPPLRCGVQTIYMLLGLKGRVSASLAEGCNVATESGRPARQPSRSLIGPG